MNVRLAGTLAIVLAATGQPVLATDAPNAVQTPGSGNSSPAPGFDCSRARSHVEQLICATPELARLDAQLGNVFNNASTQPSLDAKSLRHDEDRWLLKVRGACGDVACLKTAYEDRIETLKDQSLRAASPAAHAETRPFPTDRSLLADARSYVGKPCDVLQQSSAASASGYRPVMGFLPIVAPKAWVRAFAKKGSRFAFLMADTADGQCRIHDVVVLPTPTVANSFLQCESPTPDDAASTGIGMRLVGNRKIVAFWAIDTQRYALDRLPLGVLGVEGTMRCREPETGE